MRKKVNNSFRVLKTKTTSGKKRCINLKYRSNIWTLMLLPNRKLHLKIQSIWVYCSCSGWESDSALKGWNCFQKISRFFCRMCKTLCLKFGWNRYAMHAFSNEQHFYKQNAEAQLSILSTNIPLWKPLPYLKKRTFQSRRIWKATIAAQKIYR